MANASHKLGVAASVTCPMCDCTGWSANSTTGGYAAACGTVWAADDFLNQSDICGIISALRMQVMLLRLGVAA
jgi:hypothetical protein